MYMYNIYIVKENEKKIKKKRNFFRSEIKELVDIFLRYNFFPYLLSNFRLFFFIILFFLQHVKPTRI